MGSPVPTPPEVGDICPHCNGTLWPTDQTPKYVKVSVSNIQACPYAPHPSPHGIYILKQVQLQPCIWRATYPPYVLQYEIQEENEILEIVAYPLPQLEWFLASVSSCSLPLFTNLLINCNPYYNYGRYGSATVAFS